ncbi:Ig-like domain-containing protein [Olivibacter sp. CPCC 100613]|uniref:tandem-95 repeat protein n=1 Tax=Olivibacter sp. CPCC 100613 TaxID=3079931 RepID=UPI002FFCB439
MERLLRNSSKQPAAFVKTQKVIGAACFCVSYLIKKRLLLLVFTLSMGSFTPVAGQRITYGGCVEAGGFRPTYELNQYSTINDDGIVRNSFKSNPINGNFGELIIIKWDANANKWMIFFNSFDGDDGPNNQPLYSSSVATYPNPPNLIIGNWTKVDAYGCTPLDAANGVLSGDVMDTEPNPSNTAPTATVDVISVTEDIPATGNVLTNDSDTENNALTASLVSAPVNGTVVLNADGSFTYTPNANFDNLDSLLYQVCDNGTPSLCDTAWVRFTVEAMNDDPIITGLPSDITVREDAQEDPFDISSATISDVDARSGELTLILDATGGIFDIATGTGVTITGHLTTHLTLTGNLTDLNNYISTPSNIYFRPDRNLSGDNAALVEVSINDNGNTGSGGGNNIAIGTINIDITPVNDAPEAVDDELDVEGDTPKTGNVLANDTDVDGDALTASLVTAPVNGTVVLNANGSFTYTPNANFGGSDSLLYQVCDNGIPSLCDTATVRFTVIVNTPLPCGWAATQNSGSSGSCVLCSVTNPGQAVDADKETYSRMQVPVGLNGGEVFQTLIFATGSATSEIFRLGLSAEMPLIDAALLRGLTLTFYNGSTQVAQYNDVTAMDLDPAEGGNPAELHVASGVAFDRVRIALVATNGNLTSIQIHYARIAPSFAGVDQRQVDIYEGETATFTITDPVPGLTYRWYSESDDLLFTGLSFTTPALTDTTTYYVATSNVTGCESRIPIEVRVLPPASPELTTSIGTSTFTESIEGNPVPIVIDDALTIVDPDNVTLVSATVMIIDNLQSEDVLAFVNDGVTMGNITGLYDVATGTLTLTSIGGTATLAQWQAALRSVTYNNMSQNPNTADRIIGFQVNDGTNNSNSATKTIAVVAVNTPPITIDDAVAVQEDTPTSGNVLTNDTDPEGDALTASLVKAPVNGTVVLNADGSFTYTPNANYDGLDSLVYQVCDNGTPSRCDTAWVRLTIEAMNDAPVNIVPGNQMLSQNNTLSFSTENGNLISVSDVDAGNETIQITLTTTNGLLSLASTTGLNFDVGSGTGDASMTFKGTLVNINQALDGLEFAATRGYTGLTSLEVSSNDLGHSGAGGAKTDRKVTHIEVIDDTDPVVISVSVPANGYYREGDVLDFEVNFSEDVRVNTDSGTPYLEVIIGAATVQANYSKGSGTNALTFNYMVQAGDKDLDGIELNNNLVLNGSILSDAADNEVIPTLNNVGPTDNVFVYSVKPTVTLSTSAGTPVNAPFSVEATFSEAVTGLTLNDISVSHATLSDLQTNDNITYTFLVTPITGGIVRIAVPADVAVNIGNNGNIASNTLEMQYNIIIKGITLEDSVFVYDGDEKSLAIKGTLPQGTRVSYANNGRTEVGTQEVTATVTGANYEDLVLTANLIISKADIKGITLGDSVFVYDGDEKSLAIKGTLPQGTRVSYANNGRTEVGTQEVTVTVSGRNYNPLVLKANLQIRSIERHIDFPALPEKTYGDSDFDARATANSGEQISYSSSNVRVATISANGRIHIIAAGETVITATVPENTNYSNKPVASRKLVVRKASQEITFAELSEVARNARSIPLEVSASSTLPVRLEVSDSQVATVSGITLNVLRLGTVIITAYQEGDANYEAASPVSIRVRVTDNGATLPIKVHKALSPNGDGINDFLMIEGVKDYPDNKLVIVDRNGMQVIEMRGYNNEDKVFRGLGPGNNPIPPGTYYYLLEVKVNGEWKYEKGYFVVRY